MKYKPGENRLTSKEGSFDVDYLTNPRRNERKYFKPLTMEALKLRYSINKK